MNRAQRRQHIKEQRSLVEHASKSQPIMHARDYTDHDPGIVVEVTDTEVDYCIRLKIDNQQIDLHTRSAIDLSQKLQKAITDWIALAARELIEGKL